MTITSRALRLRSPTIRIAVSATVFLTPLAFARQANAADVDDYITGGVPLVNFMGDGSIGDAEPRS